MHIFGKGASARGGDGGESGQLFNKSAVNAVRETKIFNKQSLRSLVMLAACQERGKCGECLGQQGRGGRGEHGQGLILSFG